MTPGRRRVLVAVALFVVALAGAAVWLGRPDSGPPARVWYCAATDELRETVAGPTITGFETSFAFFPRKGQASMFLREISFTERWLSLGSTSGKEAPPVHPLWPTGVVITDGAKSWEEYTVDLHRRSGNLR